MSPHVIYARKSTESEDRQVLSIDSQIKELRGIATRKGIQVGEVLTETKSAKAPGRPVFGALMKRVNHGQIRGIICWKMDRLARNHLDTGAILQALADGKLEEVVTSDRTYTRDGNDRFMGNFELGMATKYIDDLRANVKRGNRARFERGWVNHNPRLGWLLDPATKNIIDDPERFSIIRRMYEFILTGAFRPSQVLKIANNDWGLRTRKYRRIGGKPLALSTFYAMLSDPFYYGLIRLRSGETYLGSHKPMITKQEFDRIQILIGRDGRARPQKHEVPYTGLIRCGACGSMVTTETHVKPSGNRYVYYRCSRPRQKAPCREPAISAKRLDAQIIRVLSGLSMPERVQQWLEKHAELDLKAEAEHRRAALASLESALAAKTRELDTLLSLRLRDLLDDEAYAARRKLLGSEREAIQATLAAPSRATEDITKLSRETFNFAARCASLFQTGTTVQRRMILEAVVLNATLRARKLLIQVKNPFSLLAEAGALSNWWTIPEDVGHFFRETNEYFSIPDLGALDTTISPQNPLFGKEG